MVYNIEGFLMINEQQLKALLDKYLSDQLTPQESALLEAWLAHRQAIGQRLFDEKGGGDDSEFEQTLFNDIINEIGIKQKKRPVKWLAAASIVLAIALGGLGYWSVHHSTGDHANSENLVTEKNHELNNDSLFWRRVVNTTSETKQLVLPDGSKVSLYPHSTLKYDSSLYNVRDRRLYLSGKGFFDVAHNAGKAFIVYSRGISTMALGTAFRINGYRSNSLLKVELIRGKIRIRKEKAPELSKERDFKDIILNAGEYFSYDFKNGRTAQGKMEHVARHSPGKQVKPDRSINRAKEVTVLTYDRSALTNVLEDLKAAYHVEIDYKKEDISAIQFSGSIAPDDNIQHILKKIGLLNDLQVKRMDTSRFRIDKIN